MAPRLARILLPLIAAISVALASGQQLLDENFRIGGCQDRNDYCRWWSDEGYCGSMWLFAGESVPSLCPLSCNACSQSTAMAAAAEDTKDMDCEGLAMQGLCLERFNDKKISDLCPVSCQEIVNMNSQQTPSFGKVYESALSPYGCELDETRCCPATPNAWEDPNCQSTNIDFPICTDTALDASSLYGCYGELYDRKRMFDFTGAGLNASQTIPVMPVTTLTGIVGDGETDNTQVFQSLFRNASLGLVSGSWYIPPGNYVINGQLAWQPPATSRYASNFEIVGEGRDATTLFFNGSLTKFTNTWCNKDPGCNVSSVPPGDPSNDARYCCKSSNYRYNFGAISFVGAGINYGKSSWEILLPMSYGVGSAKRGDRQISVAWRKSSKGATNKFRVGQWIQLSYFHYNVTRTPFRAMVNYNNISGTVTFGNGTTVTGSWPMEYPYLGKLVSTADGIGNPTVVVAAKVTSLVDDGTVAVVGLSTPLPYDFDASKFEMRVYRRQANFTNLGVRNLAVAFPEARSEYNKHWLEEGFNGIYFKSVENFWVSGVRLHNADNGIIAYGMQSLISDVEFTADPWVINDFQLQYYLGRNRSGHCGVYFSSGGHHLFQHLNFKASFIHDLSVTNYVHSSVFRNITGIDLVFDHHRGLPGSNLYTNIYGGAGTKGAYMGGNGGNWDADGFAGAAFVTFWNVRWNRPALPGSWDYLVEPTFVSALGVVADGYNVTKGMATSPWVGESGKLAVGRTWVDYMEPKFWNVYLDPTVASKPKLNITGVPPNPLNMWIENLPKGVFPPDLYLAQLRNRLP